MDAFISRPVDQGSDCTWIQHLGQDIFSKVVSLVSLRVFLVAFLHLLFAEATCNWQRRVLVQMSIKGFGYNNGQLASWFKKHINIFHVVRVADYNSLYAYGVVQNGIATLVKVLVSFPFQTEKFNEWFVHKVSQDDADPTAQRTIDVNVINVHKARKKGKVKGKVYATSHEGSLPYGQADEDHKIFFHGTNHQGAENIILQGIDLSQGTKCGDFSSGNGFYLYDNLEEALDWACKNQENPAVLIYRLKKKVLGTANGLDLTGDANKREWKDVVRKYGLRDKALMKAHKTIDFIEGPMAKRSSKLSKDYFKHPIPKDNSYQLCVRSHDMSKKFNSFLNSVCFYWE